MDVGVHCVDLLRFLVGEVEEVVGLTGNVVFHYPVEDISTLLLRFKGGAQGIIDNTFSVDTKNSPNGLEIYGTKGSITTEKTISCSTGGTMTTIINEEEKRYPASEVNTYQKEIENFASGVEKPRESFAVDKAGLRALKIVLAGYESARLKQSVQIA